MKKGASGGFESEQITEGGFFFGQGEKIIGVRAGEVIAIPAYAPHAVFTEEAAIRAADAWSPVMEKYRK